MTSGREVALTAPKLEDDDDEVPTGLQMPANGKVKFDLTVDFWNEWTKAEDPNILGAEGLTIAHDSGVSDVDELLYTMKYFYAGLIVVGTVLNTYILCRLDLYQVYRYHTRAVEQSERKFLLTTSIIHLFDKDPVHEHRVQQIIPLFELAFLFLLYARILITSFLIAVAPRCKFLFGEGGEMYRWSLVGDLFWELLQQLSTFSAMRLLYFVTPSVAGTQGTVIAWLVKHNLAAARSPKEKLVALLPMFQYVTMLLVCTVVGVDAFLVRYRMTSTYVMSDELSMHAVVFTFVFVFQVLGIVNLNWYARERLFIFIFGGEDGQVEPEEKMRWDLWNAVMAKRIYDHFGWVKGTVVMLGFDDYDFQSLVLDDSGKEEKMKAKADHTYKSDRGVRSTAMSDLNRLTGKSRAGQYGKLDETK